MKRGDLFAGGSALAALVLLAVGPRTARAGDLDFSSSMTASCVGLDCQTVQFALDLDSDTYARFAPIQGEDAAIWQAGNLIGVTGEDANGRDETDGAVADGMALQASGSGGAGRLYMAVGMTAAGAALWASQTYRDGGDPLAYRSSTGAAGNGNSVGTVTPEPVSLVLLGTGLAGIAGVGHRRRRRSRSDME